MPAGHKNPGIIEAEVKMERQVNDCSFLIVEGADDARFWGPRRHSACTLVDGEGKPNVVAAVQRLDGDVGGVLGIVDEDYDCLMGKSLGSSNLVAVSPHDLECFLLCQAPAFDRVLAEFGTQTKIASFEAREGIDVRTALLRRASHFGQLRWAAQACDLNVCEEEDTELDSEVPGCHDVAGGPSGADSCGGGWFGRRIGTLHWPAAEGATVAAGTRA